MSIPLQDSSRGPNPFFWLCLLAFLPAMALPDPDPFWTNANNHNVIQDWVCLVFFQKEVFLKAHTFSKRAWIAIDLVTCSHLNKLLPVKFYLRIDTCSLHSSLRHVIFIPFGLVCSFLTGATKAIETSKPWRLFPLLVVGSELKLWTHKGSSISDSPPPRFSLASQSVSQ
jgi:hypothetical protein